MKKKFKWLIALSITIPFVSIGSFITVKNVNYARSKLSNEINEDVGRITSFEEISYLEVDSSLVKKVYTVNEEIDITNLKVYKHLNNGEKIECLDDEYNVQPVDTTIAGYKNVIISYGDFYASYQITVKGFIYHNYDEKNIYYLNEEFDKNNFELIKYDENGEHYITDYDVSFPDNIVVGLGQIRISYEDFLYVSNIAIMKKPDNVPLIFYSEDENYSLYLFVNNIHDDIYNGENCRVSEGYYLLVSEDRSLDLYDFKYTLLNSHNASYFGSSSDEVSQRLIPNGALLVTIKGIQFIIDSITWHHCVIGW